MNFIVIVGQVNDQTETFGKRLINEYPNLKGLFRLGDTDRLSHSLNSLFTPLFSVLNYSEKTTIYENAKNWSWTTSQSWSDISFKYLDNYFDLNFYRSYENQMILERFYLIAAYIRSVIQNTESRIVYVSDDLPPDEQTIIKEVALSLDCKVELSFKSIGYKSNLFKIFKRKYFKIFRDYIRLLRFPFLLFKWILVDKTKPVRGVLLDATCTTAVKNLSVIKQRLIDSNISICHVGFISTSIWGNRDKHSDLTFIKKSQIPTEENSVNLLSFFPTKLLLYLPMLWLKIRSMRRKTICKMPYINLSENTSVKLEDLKDTIMRQFIYDYLFVLCSILAGKQMMNIAESVSGIIISTSSGYPSRILSSLKLSYIPCAIVQDGSISDSPRLSYKNFDYFCVWGPYFSDILNKYHNIPSEKIVITGPHRLSKHNMQYVETKNQNKKNIVFISQKQSVEAYPLFELIKILKWISCEAKKYPEFNFYIRPHPRDNVQELYHLLRGLDINNIYISNSKNINAELNESYLIIALFSTVIFEAIAKEVPVLIIDCSNRDQTLLYEEFGESFIISEKQFQEKLYKLLREKDYYRKISSKQYTLSKKIFHPFDNMCIERIITLINKDYNIT